MKCTSCGGELLDNAKFCTYCGVSVPVTKAAEPVKPPMAEPVKPVTPPAQPVPPTPQSVPILPPAYKPLTPWAYFGLQVLFCIPLVGFICLIVFSLDDGNIHRRNFARSYWCNLIVSVAVAILLIILLVATGVTEDVFSELNYML